MSLSDTALLFVQLFIKHKYSGGASMGGLHSQTSTHPLSPTISPPLFSYTSFPQCLVNRPIIYDRAFQPLVVFGKQKYIYANVSFF